VDLGVAFVAGAQPAKVVQVREAALDDPALPAEIGAVLGSAPGDDGLDAARPEQPPVLVVVIAAVGEDEIGLLPGAAWLAATGRARSSSSSGSSWVMSLRLPPVSVIASRMPLASTRRWCLEPARARSTGDGPVRSPQKGARMWLESAAARDQSILPAALSLTSSL
jgi:hypothetical protein